MPHDGRGREAGQDHAVLGWPLLQNRTICRQRDQPAIAAASATDGLYALATNLPGKLTIDDLLRIYMEQSLVELRHRDLKSSLHVRPNLSL